MYTSESHDNAEWQHNVYRTMQIRHCAKSPRNIWLPYSNSCCKERTESAPTALHTALSQTRKASCEVQRQCSARSSLDVLEACVVKKSYS